LAVNAVVEALNSPLLEVDISEATGALVNVTGGEDMTISEAERVVEEIYSRVDQNARIIWGEQLLILNSRETSVPCWSLLVLNQNKYLAHRRKHLKIRSMVLIL